MLNKSDHNLEKLKEGFMFWNKHRTTLDEQEGIIDFSNLRIDGSNWRYNELKNAELHHCNFQNTEFRDIDFIDIDFSGSDFTNARFINVRFTKCRFSLISFKNVVFKDTSWFHASLDAIDFSELNAFDNIRFFKCFLNKDILKGMDPQTAIFEDCDFKLNK